MNGIIGSNLKKYYDPTFTVSEQYKDNLPDMQNGPASLIEGADVPIQQVGVSNFRLPLRIPVRDGKFKQLETSVDGYVGLEAGKKGINMSRIVRTFYEFQEELFHIDKLHEVLEAYREDLDTQTGQLRLSFNYPMLQESLRSELEGYQYYPVKFEGTLDAEGTFRKFLHLDFDYSSACPCSYELAEHARDLRNIAAIPHSQRSVASLTLQLDDEMYIEDIVELCRNALQTETQVMVKREDEQAFAEKNGAYQKFVEDAARLLYEELDEYEPILDFVVRCVHMESLHSHDAVSRICKGVKGGLR